MPKYVMRCGLGPVTCLVWLGWMRVPDKKTALRRSSHALQNMLEMEVAHSVMDHANIYWEGEPDFYIYFQEARKVRDHYETWKSRERMEEMISVTQPKPNFETNKLDVIIEVVINSSQYDYIARIRITANVARKWFVDRNTRTAEYILRAAKEHMLANDYKDAKIWYRLEDAGAWKIAFVDVVEEPEPETSTTNEDEQLSLLD